MLAVDFLGIGVQKAGTTWLFKQLSSHPQIAFPRGKEVHYWDRGGALDAEEWVRLLQPPSRRAKDDRPIRVGEITPSYATLPQTTIRTIHGRCPEIGLFISLRNPIERAWSAALMGLDRCGMEEHEASDQWFLDHFHSSGSRSRGDYVTCLAHWWSVFRKEQLLVLFREDIAERPVAVLMALAKHLSIDVSDFNSLPTEQTSSLIVPGLRPGANAHRSPPPLRPSLFEPLYALYADGILRLEELLQRDLDSWRKPPTGESTDRPRVAVSMKP